jgi:hypothetical protein
MVAALKPPEMGSRDTISIRDVEPPKGLPCLVMQQNTGAGVDKQKGR